MRLTPEHSSPEEARRLFRIAGPLIAAYLAEYAMFVTTKLVVGSLGVEPLAAVGLAASLAHEGMVIMMGILSVTGVLAAQAEGAGRKQEAGHAARQGLITALILSVPLMALVWNLGAIMRLAGQEEAVAAAAEPFLHALTPFVPAMLLFTALRDFVAALSRTGPIMAITVAAVGFNWLLAEAMVHGRWGAPELGVAGAGLATSIVSWSMLAVLALYIYRKPALRGYGLFRARLRFDPKIIAVIFRLGLPIGAMVGLEAGLFTAVALLSGVIGAGMLAAHQVLMSWIGIPFVIALGIAEAGMVRVAHAVGREDPAGARQAGFVALGIGAGALTLLVAAPLLLAEEMTRLFLPASAPGFDEVAALVTQIMVVAAIFQVFDGAQAIMARCLRGLRDAYVPLWIAGFCYWPLGVGGGALLAFPLGLGGAGLWIGLAAGLIVAACLLTIRFARLSGRRIAQAAERAPEAAAS